MCGIVGYIGKKNAAQVALEGLKRLEYRGYDSSGIASFSAAHPNSLFFKKAVGKIASLEAEIKEFPASSVAVAHTRWATHGEPTVANAHPHFCCESNIFVVHNGIIENHNLLRDALRREGHDFRSETDTEVLAHLVERSVSAGAANLEEAVMEALRHVTGTFGIAVIDKREPNKMIAARRGSPLLLGIGDGEYFVASDASALVSHTRKVIYLNDNEMVVVTPDGFDIFDFARKHIDKRIDTIEWDAEQSQKSGYEHFMQKEIHEASLVIKNTIGGRAVVKKGDVKLGGLESIEDKLREIDRFVIVACGTSYYAALIGRYLFEEYAGLPVEVEHASEFRYHPAPLAKNTAVIAISQSGETADTLEAVREAKKKGNLTLGIINVVGSTIAREVHAGVYNHAGPEVAVASTKAFLSQLVVLNLLGIYLGRMRAMTPDRAREVLTELVSLPSKIDHVLKKTDHIKAIAEKYKDYKNFLYLGRKYSWPVALEGALKLKEISYIHSEGYPAGEMKHGPLAVIDENFPSIVIVPRDSVYDKTLSNMQEVKARRGKIIAVLEEGDTEAARLADDVIYIPKTLETLSPLISVVPLQLLAYYMAVLGGKDVDKPRNLAKSVTVE